MLVNTPGGIRQQAKFAQSSTPTPAMPVPQRKLGTAAQSAIAAQIGESGHC